MQQESLETDTELLVRYLYRLRVTTPIKKASPLSVTSLTQTIPKSKPLSFETQNGGGPDARARCRTSTHFPALPTVLSLTRKLID